MRSRLFENQSHRLVRLTFARRKSVNFFYEFFTLFTGALLPEGESQLPLPALEAGMYQVSVQGDGAPTVVRFVRQ
jgi:hypothetical protein